MRKENFSKELEEEEEDERKRNKRKRSKFTRIIWKQTRKNSKACDKLIEEMKKPTKIKFHAKWK